MRGTQEGVHHVEDGESARVNDPESFELRVVEILDPELERLLDNVCNGVVVDFSYEGEDDHNV